MTKPRILYLLLVIIFMGLIGYSLFNQQAVIHNEPKVKQLTQSTETIHKSETPTIIKPVKENKILTPTATAKVTGSAIISLEQPSKPMFGKTVTHQLADHPIGLLLPNKLPASFFYTKPQDSGKCMTAEVLCNEHPSFQAWFEMTLPDGMPTPITSPYQYIVTAQFKAKLDGGVKKFNSEIMFVNWFDNLTVSPSGSKIVFFSQSQIPPFSGGELPYLWSAKADGTKVTQVAKNIFWALDDADWSADETRMLVAGPPTTEGVYNTFTSAMVDLTKNSMTFLEQMVDNRNGRRTFFPRPSISPNGCCIAGNLLPLTFFSSSSGSVLANEFMILNVDTNSFKVYSLTLALTYPLWSKDNQSLYLLGREGEIYQFNLATERLTLLAKVADEKMTAHLRYETDKGFKVEIPFRWLIFPEQQTVIIGYYTGLWVVQYSKE